MRFGLQMSEHPRLVDRIGVKQTGIGIVRGVGPVLAAGRARPKLHLLVGAQLLRHLSLHRPASRHVDVTRPVDLFVRLGGDELPIGPIDHVKKTVAVELHQHFAPLSGDVDIREDQLPARVVVVGVARRELVVPDDLASLGPKRQHGGCVEIVAGPRLRRPRRRIPDSPIGEIELWVIGSGDPARPAADLPGIVVLRPGLVALLAARGNRVAAPQLLAGLGVPAVDEAADAELGARYAGDQHAVGDLRRHRHRIAVLPFCCLRLPDLLAGFHVEREHVSVEGGAIDLAVEDRRALVGNAAAHHARRLGRPLEVVLPNLLAGGNVDGDRRPGVGYVHHAVVDQRLRLLAPIVVEAQIPDRHQALEVRFVDLLERAIAVLLIAHAVGENVVAVLAVVLQIVERLGRRRGGEEQQNGRH